MIGKYVVLADLGSTKTKAALLGEIDSNLSILALASSDTTVESPNNDVMIGLFRCIQSLQATSGVALISNTGIEKRLADGVELLCTSSAGGGLQILVIGLTLFDSASSGKRAAYGAGGVILDTFAIDDKRSATQQLQDMSKLHPDMILISGGTDGGAISGVLRLVEILRMAKPSPKYEEDRKIPTIFAGNSAAQTLIKGVIRGDFDLRLMPNLRPSLSTENLKPSQDMIQKLFMENVMERAPGYSALKRSVTSDILPTPLAVLRTMELVSGKEKKNIFAFDIGGATTDVFSYVNGHYQRTVSANLGMSYSALNVLKETGIDFIKRMLPSEISETELRNYIANKTIYPTASYNDCHAMQIEHAMAKAALSKALSQHREMHYNKNKIGFLDALRVGDRDKYVDKFEYIDQEERFSFYQTDIDILIGIGGVFAATQNHMQAAMMLVDAIRPKGITKIYLDKDFLSPQIGILSKSSPDQARKLMDTGLIEPIALHLSPVFKPKSKADKVLFSCYIDDKKWDLRPDQLIVLPASPDERTLRISCAPKVFLTKDGDEFKLPAGIALILDSRKEDDYSHCDQAALKEMYTHDDMQRFVHEVSFDMSYGTWERHLSLPFKGDVIARIGDKLEPSSLLARNLYDPPRLYIVQPFSSFKEISDTDISSSLLIRTGQKIEADDLIMKAAFPISKVHERVTKFYSPVRGVVEYIDPSTGIVVLSEIQDYDNKTHVVPITTPLGLKPAKLKLYLKQQKGDFVIRGEVLAKRVDSKVNSLQTHIKAPTTGTIVDVDHENGAVSIKYLSKPTHYYASVHGEVVDTDQETFVRVAYSGYKLEGLLGFGRECGGALRIVCSPEQLVLKASEDSILFLSYSPGRECLSRAAKAGVKGLILGWVDAEILSSYLGFEPGVINTGSESIPMSLLILCGFGSQSLSQDIVNRVIELEGSHTYLQANTRIRAGVVRPLLCIQQKKT